LISIYVAIKLDGWWLDEGHAIAQAVSFGQALHRPGFE